MKVVLKLLGWLAVIAAAVCALAYWDKKTTPDYIEIYSDGEDEEDAF